MAELDRVNGVTVVVRNDEDEIARLRGEIALRRRRLGSSFDQIEARVVAGIDWRHWVRAHPWTSLAAGAVIGYAIGQMGRDRRRYAAGD